MRVVVLHNPHSGRGNGHRAGSLRVALDALTDRGIRYDLLARGPGLSRGDLESAIVGARALIIAGGDGSMHHAAPIAIASTVPVYHFPLGTENLFAREFGMDRRPETLVAALERGRVREVDAAVCGDRIFVIMASLGFDAAVVGRVAAARLSGVRRIDYVRRSLEAFREFAPSHLNVSVDGRTIVDDRPGLLICANSRQYAAYLNPASAARIDDGLLDIVFLPFTTRLGLAQWLISIAARTHSDDPRLVTATGRAVTVHGTHDPIPLQLDGESAGFVYGQPRGGNTSTPAPLNFSIRPRALRVLEPPGRF